MADPQRPPARHGLQTLPTTWDDLSKRYANLYEEAKEDRNRMARALDAVPRSFANMEERIVERVLEKVDASEGRMLAAVGELSRRIAEGQGRRDYPSNPPARSVSPQPRSYNLKASPTGSVKLEEVQAELDDLAAQVREANAREEGAKAALAERKKDEEDLRKKLAWYGAGIAAAFTALAWLASHFLHL